MHCKLQTANFQNTVIVIDEHGLRMSQYPSTSSALDLDLNLMFPRVDLRDHLLPTVSILIQFSMFCSILNVHSTCHAVCPPPNPSFITAPVSGQALHEMTARYGILPMAVNVNLAYSFCSAHRALCTKVILYATMITVLLYGNSTVPLWDWVLA